MHMGVSRRFLRPIACNNLVTVLYVNYCKSYFYYIECRVDLGEMWRSILKEIMPQKIIFPLQRWYYGICTTSDDELRMRTSSCDHERNLFFFSSRKYFFFCKVALIWLLIITKRTHSLYDLDVESCLEKAFYLIL